MKNKSTHTTRGFNALITRSGTLKEILVIKELLMKELNHYSVEDQGFLLAMVGLRILKFVGEYENLERFPSGSTTHSYLQSNNN